MNQCAKERGGGGHRNKRAMNEVLKQIVISCTELDSPWPQHDRPHTSILSEDVARAPTDCVALKATVLVITITSQVSPQSLSN